MRNLTIFVLCLTFSFLLATPLTAQEAPPDTSQPADTSQPQEVRIVDHRPFAYFLKRELHPFTWIDAGLFRPAYDLGTGSRVRSLIERRNSNNGPSSPVSFALAGMGPGSGFGPLITPHFSFFHDKVEIQTPLLYTYKSYQDYEVDVHVPAAAKSYFFVDGRYLVRPSDAFFGIGNDTPVSNESYFKTVQRVADAGYTAGINKNLKATIGLSFDKVGVTKPSFGDSAQTLFSQSEVPGLFTGASMRAITLAVDHNNQDDPHRATRGGMEIAEVGLHESVGAGDFAYWKYRLELQHYFSLSKDRRKIIAFRSMFETNQEKGGSQVPVFDMPYLGSWETLRGFESYRYRDKSALALGLEYRYRIWRALDWGLFVDRGLVAPDPSDFAWSRMHTGYGVRLFALPSLKFPVTVDLGRSNEKWRLYININPNF